MTHTVELWHTSGPTPVHVATVNAIGELHANTRINTTTERGPVNVDMNVTPTPEGLDVLHDAFAATVPGTYEVRFAETPSSAAHTWHLQGHLIHFHGINDNTDLTWKAHIAGGTPAQEPAPPLAGPSPATGPLDAAQCMANASRLLAWAELESDLAKMNQYNELAQTWINLASLHQGEVA